MKRILIFCAILCATALTFVSCKKDETYAKQKKKERNAIETYIKNSPLTLYDNEGGILLKDTLPIQVIDEIQFEKQDSMTYAALNQYVLFPKTGIYMQIVRQGVGNKIKPGDRGKNIICRYWEYNIIAGSLLTTNRVPYWTSSPDIINVSNNSGSISASFDSNHTGAMFQAYNSLTVPQAWIVPLSYIKVGRDKKDGDEIAKVRLIVPHTQGTDNAANAVYPCIYEITYEEMR